MTQRPRGTRLHLGRRVAMSVTLLTLTASTLRAQGVAPVGAPAVGKIDQQAVTALRRMGTTLRSLKSFGVKVSGARDDVMDDGQKIQIAGSVRYLVRTPDRFRADIATDRMQRTIQYDGKTLALYAPRMHYFATVPAPSTVDEMLDTVRAKYGVELPVADLFLWGTPRDGVNELTEARYIGPAMIDGAVTDQYAFRQPGTDWQIWIERGEQALPRKLVITTTDGATQPQYVATLAWNLTATTDDAAFTFVPPKDATRITWGSPFAAAVGIAVAPRSK